MIWNREIETAPRAALRALQAERLPPPWRGRARGCRSTGHARRGLDGGRGRRPGAARRPAVHAQGRPARALPVRPLRGAARAAGAHPRLLRHARQAHRGGLHRGPTSSSGARSWRAPSRRAGAAPGQLVQVAYGYGLFTGGLGFHDGAEHMGLTVVPISSGNTAAPDPAAAGLPARRAWPARPPSRSTSARRCGSRGSTPARWAALRAVRRRAVDGGDAGRSSRRCGAARRWTSTGSAR